jgi:hypothetical protein
MGNAMFIGDLLEEVGNLTMVNSFNYRYEQYGFEEIEGKKYIVGKGFINQFEDELSFDGPELLFSLVNLVTGEMPEFFNSPHLDNVITEENIMEWCEKYGLPYTDQHFWENEKLNNKGYRFDNVLELNHFRYRLAWLYSQFNLWLGVINDDSEEIKKWSFAVKVNLDAINILHPSLTEIDSIKKALAYEISNITKVKVSLDYNVLKGTFEFKLLDQSLFSIAYYQFAALTTKSPSDSKKKMKNCNYCNSIFWANSAKKKYCSNCDRRTIWSRRNKKD